MNILAKLRELNKRSTMFYTPNERTAREKRTVPMCRIKRLLTNFCLVNRLDPHLLIFIQIDVFSALNDHGSDTDRRTDTRTDRGTNRPAGDRADHQSGSGGSANLYAVRFDGRFTDRGAFGIDEFNVIAFYRHYLGHDGVEIRPTFRRQNDAVKRERHFRTLFDAAGLFDLVDAAFDDRACDL